MKKLLVIAAVAALASLSFGQGRMFMMGGRGGGGLQLALREDVAKELALTADQKTKLQDAQDQMRDERRQMFQSMGGGGGNGGANGGGPDQATMDKMRKDMQDKEQKVLSGIL